MRNLKEGLIADKNAESSEADSSLPRRGKLLHLTDFLRDTIDVLDQKLDHRGSTLVASLKLVDSDRDVLIRRNYSRILTNTRMIMTLTCIARSLLITEESIATPCSVNAYGRVRRPPRLPFAIAICKSKPSASAWVNWNIKSAGNLDLLRRTARFRFPVVTA